MITTEVQFNDWWTWLQSSNGYKNNFTYDGAKAVFEYMDDYYENVETSEPDNYDPVAWCCEFSEYESLDELKDNYNDIETLEDLQNNTSVIELNNGGLVIVDY